MKHLLKLFAILFAAVIVSCNQQPQYDTDPKVWNNPPAVSNSQTFRNGGWDFCILKVEFGDTATTIRMRVRGYSGELYSFAKETFLRADGQTYKLLSIDGLTPGEYKPMNKQNAEYLTFYFEPMPSTIKSFDLIESEFLPRAFNIYGVHKNNPDSQAIIGTHWRNLRTGDWVVSFLDSCVIYNCNVWKYMTKPESESASSQTVVINRNDQVASIEIGPLKHGKRTIRIQAPDGPKQFTCAAFESRHLPDFPKVARHAYKLVDFGYDKIDTVTVNGVLIGPGRNNMSFAIDVIDPIAGLNPNYAFKTDDNGFFSVSFPIANVSCAVVRGGRISGFQIPVEPGQTYFVYDNTITGQEFVMGERSRVQNDFMTHNMHFYADYDRHDETPFGDDTDVYLEYLIRTRDAQMARLDSLREAHPGITDAFLDLSRVYATIDLYENIGQARFPRDNRPPIIPDHMMKFLMEDSKTHPFTPYSLYYDINYFVRDLSQSLTLAAQEGSNAVHISDYLEDALNNDTLKISADDRELMRWYARTVDVLEDLVREFQSDRQKLSDTIQKIVAEKEEQLQKAANVLQETGIADYIENNASKVMIRREFNDILCALDTLGFEPMFNKIVITQYLVRELTSAHHSLPAAIVAMFDSIVPDKAFQDALHQQQEKYLALESVDLASLGDVVSAQDLANMSDGEQILRKLTEPYRGKIVYIDVWGSWCSPCLQNLEHAGELKAALKEFDIVYLYLASSTSDVAWKGVIKEYNLTGPDCVHYNLPDNQQMLVEQFLKVNGYPTYRLLNRNGALLDVSCHPSDLTSLIETLKKL